MIERNYDKASFADGRRYLALLLPALALAGWSLLASLMASDPDWALTPGAAESAADDADRVTSLVLLPLEVEQQQSKDSEQPADPAQKDEQQLEVAKEEKPKAPVSDVAREESSPKIQALAGDVRDGGVTAVNRSGRSPSIHGRFDVNILDYVNAVRRLTGGRLLVWDKATEGPVGEIIGDRFTAATDLAQFSNRARDITSDLPASYRANILQQVREEQSFGLFRFVLVIPESAEARFQRSISAALAEAGLSWAELELLQLRYRIVNGHVVAQVETASSAGKTVAVNKTVQLW